MGSGSRDFSTNPHLRGGLEIIAAEYSHRVVRFKLWSGGRISQCSGKVETLDTWVIVRRIEAHNLGIAAGRLRKEIGIRANQIGDFHFITVRVAAGTKNVALKIDGAFVVGRDGKNVDLIAVLDFEGAELLSNGIRIAGRGNIQS